MCVATAGRVLSMDGGQAIVDIGGNRCPVYIGYVRAKVGDYVLVHAGYAMQVMTPESARELTELFAEVEEAADGR